MAEAARVSRSSRCSSCTTPDRAGDLRGSVLLGCARYSRACNGRPANLLKVQGFSSAFRLLIPPCGGSIPPAPAKDFKALVIRQLSRSHLSRRAIPTIVRLVFSFQETPPLCARCQPLALGALDIDSRGLRRPMSGQRHDALLINSASPSSVMPPCRQAARVTCLGNPAIFLAL